MRPWGNRPRTCWGEYVKRATGGGRPYNHVPGERNDVKVSAREKKILYTGSVIAVAILIYYGVTLFSPGDGESLAVRVETQANLLRRQKELIGREDLYNRRIEDAKNDIAQIQARLLPGNNATVANTELQRILNDFAEQSGVVITTKNGLPEKKVADSESLIKISTQMQITCGLDQLVDFLRAIKNHDKFIKVEDINVLTAQQQRVMQLRPLTMVVVGYISAVPLPEPAVRQPVEDEVPATAPVGRRR